MPVLAPAVHRPPETLPQSVPLLRLENDRFYVLAFASDAFKQIRTT